MKSEGESFLGVGESQRKDDEKDPPRYPALIALSRVYRLLAILTGIGAVIVVIVGMNQDNTLLVFYGLLGGVFGVIGNLAISEGIRVFLDIEENTRNSYYCLWNLINK